jgi:hypothetical protein
LSHAAPKADVHRTGPIEKRELVRAPEVSPAWNEVAAEIWRMKARQKVRHKPQVDRAQGRIYEPRQRFKHPIRARIDLHIAASIRREGEDKTFECEEDRTLRAVLVGMLREHLRYGRWKA